MAQDTNQGPLGDSIQTGEIGDGQVTAVKLASDAVETAKIKDANITMAKLAADIAIGSKLQFSPYLHDSVIQGTWTNSMAADLWRHGWITNTSNAINDGIRYKAFINAGTYTVRIIANESTGAGIVHISVGGSEIGTIDFYAAGNTPAIVFKGTGFTVAASGYQNIDFEMKSKNASSSGYLIHLQLIVFEKTA